MTVPEREMTTAERLLIGGAGAVTPVLFSLLIYDLEPLLRHADWIEWLGRLGVLIGCFLSGVLYTMFRKEANRLKVFELGLMAPAFFLSTVNARRAEEGQNAIETHSSQDTVDVNDALEETAVDGAAPNSSLEGASPFFIPASPEWQMRFVAANYSNRTVVHGLQEEIRPCLERRSVLKRLRDGVFGVSGRRSWSVYSAPTETVESAENLVAEIQRTVESAASSSPICRHDTLGFLVVLVADTSGQHAADVYRRLWNAGLAVWIAPDDERGFEQYWERQRERVQNRTEASNDPPIRS